MRTLVFLVFMALVVYGGYQLWIERRGSPAARLATPCERLGTFVQTHVPVIVGPVILRDGDERYWSPEMPVTELMELTSSFRAEAQGVPPPNRARYAALLAVCDALRKTIAERQEAYTKFERSAQAYTRYSSPWTEIVARHNARWAERAAVLMKEIDVLYTRAKHAEAEALR